MAKKEPKPVGDKQITFRLSGQLHKRLESAAVGLALDISSLLRMMIRENLNTYERRVDEIRRREDEGEEDRPG